MEFTIDVIGNIVGPLLWLLMLAAAGLFGVRGALAERREASAARAARRDDTADIDVPASNPGDPLTRTASHDSSPAFRRRARIREPFSRRT